MVLEGAEAVLKEEKFAGFTVLRKLRVSKKYRPTELDEKLRVERTRREARILHRCKETGVLCPSVFAVGLDYILIEKLDGEILSKLSMGKKKISARVYSKVGEYLAKMHKHGIVHGDFTPANLMLVSSKLYVIDFGLGRISYSDEDRAVDLLTFVDAVSEKEGSAFLRAYEKFGDRKVVLKMRAIENRGRYRKRE